MEQKNGVMRRVQTDASDTIALIKELRSSASNETTYYPEDNILTFAMRNSFDKHYVISENKVYWVSDKTLLPDTLWDIFAEDPSTEVRITFTPKIWGNKNWATDILIA
jgi:hypothetical protein